MASAGQRLVRLKSYYKAGYFSFQSSTQMLAAPYIIPLTNMAMTGSVYTVVAITVERYTTLRQINQVRWFDRIMRHFNYFHLQPPLKGKFLIFFIIFFSVSYNFVKFFELTVDIKVNNRFAKRR